MGASRPFNNSTSSNKWSTGAGTAPPGSTRKPAPPSLPVSLLAQTCLRAVQERVGTAAADAGVGAVAAVDHVVAAVPAQRVVERRAGDVLEAAQVIGAATSGREVGR